MKATLLTSVYALVLAASPVYAQDAGLYDDVLDPSKAYVRVMAEESADATVDGTPLTLLEHNVSGYLAVTPGALAIGPEGTSQSVEAGTFYTFVSNADGVTQFVDSPVEDPTKAEILFYNLTDGPVDLFVPEAKTNALAGVQPGTSDAVELRAPLTLSFAAQADGTVLATVEGVELERKQATSLFLVAGPQGPELVQVVNAFADPS